jgi:hypothetical protein
MAKDELRSNENVHVVDDEETRIEKKIRIAKMQEELDLFQERQHIRESEQHIRESEQHIRESEQEIRWIETAKIQISFVESSRAKCVLGASASQMQWIKESFQSYITSVYRASMGDAAQRYVDNAQAYVDVHKEPTKWKKRKI